MGENAIWIKKVRINSNISCHVMSFTSCMYKQDRRPSLTQIPLLFPFQNFHPPKEKQNQDADSSTYPFHPHSSTTYDTYKTD